MKLHFPIYYNDFSRSKVKKKVKVFCNNECRFESVYHVLEILYFGCVLVFNYIQGKQHT